MTTVNDEHESFESGPQPEGDTTADVPEVEGALARSLSPSPADEPITREQRRSRRKRDIRARTISVRRMTKRELEIGRMLYPETDYWKPKTRAECVDELALAPTSRASTTSSSTSRPARGRSS